MSDHCELSVQLLRGTTPVNDTSAFAGEESTLEDQLAAATSDVHRLQAEMDRNSALLDELKHQQSEIAERVATTVDEAVKLQAEINSKLAFCGVAYVRIDDLRRRANCEQHV